VLDGLYLLVIICFKGRVATRPYQLQDVRAQSRRDCIDELEYALSGHREHRKHFEGAVSEGLFGFINQARKLAQEVRVVEDFVDAIDGVARHMADHHISKVLGISQDFLL